MIGSLVYLMICTRPDIAHAVQRLSCHLHAPRAPHLVGAKRVLRYLAGTKQHGIQFGTGEAILTGFSDASWATRPDRRSTTGFCWLYLGGMIMWKSVRQRITALSSCEAEYIAAAEAARESVWLHGLMRDLGSEQECLTLNCDNKSAIATANTTAISERTKHIDVRHHYLRELVRGGVLVLHFVPTADMLADALTKTATKHAIQKFVRWTMVARSQESTSSPNLPPQGLMANHDKKQPNQRSSTPRHQVLSLQAQSPLIVSAFRQALLVHVDQWTINSLSLMRAKTLSSPSAFEVQSTRMAEDPFHSQIVGFSDTICGQFETARVFIDQSTSWPMQTVRASLRDVIREAVEVLEYRDVVYRDPHAKQWTTSLEVDDVVVAAFGDVEFNCLRSVDGVVVGKHECGQAFLQGRYIAANDDGQARMMTTVAFPPSVGDKDNDGCDTTDMENSTVFTPRPTPRGGKRDAIDLCGCFLQAQDVPYVTIPLSSNYFIRSLNLSGNALHDASAVLIATALSSNGALEELVLSYNAIATEGSLALAACLATNNYLRRLDLSHNHIGGSGLHGWLTLKQNSALEALNLSHNRDISDQGGLDVLRAVAAEPLSLYDQVKLDLLRKNPTHSYTPQLMDAPANATLRSLCLSEVGLSVQSALRLALVLQVNTVLTHLDVSMNGFADDSNVAVAQALAQNRSLTVLNYAANPLSDTAAAIMATSLSGHPALTTVHFSGCFSGPVAGASLASTVISNRTLTSMDLVRQTTYPLVSFCSRCVRAVEISNHLESLHCARPLATTRRSNVSN
ncbi:hypothetical protein, variant [Aphanomyces invadans]|uniref:Reverse transcriptase Ty1/copia-type domain-containing protein n=1 Tax=Aphanomyces invadans TaxID=157072 RepID=A0A024UH48_9STRA|nr:hypothetical protein, variant [Aphanomyces invadans]ETW05515.1 hypothetical protein, variant [Aphanomyces invadans]|eukprot:XP_008865292.1 hypothetical protein, variant [Aphanomyces invadans]